MLAYVFWHWPRATIAAPEYESLQRRFQDALLAAPPTGLIGSRVSAIEGAPWAGGGRAAYEDWYLLEDSAAIDSLNTAAITAARRLPHDAAAAAAEGGTAGLYRLRGGDPSPAPRVTTWFAKPDGMTYDRLHAALAPLVAGGAVLWGRQMVLGPSPEFCLHAGDDGPLPPSLRPHTVTHHRPIWP